LREQGLETLLATLAEYNRGTTPVCIEYQNNDAAAEIRAGLDWRVQPQSELLRNLEQLHGAANVELVY